MSETKDHAAPEPQAHIEESTSGWREWVFRGSLLAAAFGFLVSVLPLLPVNWWWIRIGDYPRLQLMLAILVAAGVTSRFLPRRRAAVATLALAFAACIQAYYIFPYTVLAPHETQDARTSRADNRIRIFSCNVLQGNRDEEAVRRVIESSDADIVLLMEVNRRWVEAVEPSLKGYPHRLLEPLDNKYGMAFYSRLPTSGMELRHYVKEGIPSVVADVRMPNGVSVRVFCVHPNPPRPGEDTTKRDGELVLVGRDAAEYPGPVLVVGDMNDVGWSRTSNLFQEVSRLLDPRKGRGFYNTFDATSWVWRYPLDYVYHSDEFRLVELRRLPFVGSDHFPLVIELAHEPTARAAQEAPEKDADDVEDAAEAVEEAREEVREGDDAPDDNLPSAGDEASNSDE